VTCAITALLPVTRSIAHAAHHRTAGRMDLDDLSQIAALGLVEAAHRYGTDDADQLRGQATARAQGACIDAMREADRMTRGQRQQLRTARTAADRLTADLLREPTSAEIAAAAGMSTGQYHALLIGQHEDVAIDYDPDIAIDQDDGSALRDAMRLMLALDDAALYVVARLYFDDADQREVAVEMGVHESRIYQIHQAALTTMRGVAHAC